MDIFRYVAVIIIFLRPLKATAREDGRLVFSEQLRQELKKRKESKYRICKDSAVDFATLSRFLRGGAISSKTIDKLVDYLKIEIRRRSSR